MRSAMLYFEALTLGIVCILGIGSGPSAAAGDSPAAVKRTAERTVAVDARTQQAVDAWAEEEKRLLQEIDRKEREIKRFAWEREKTADYLATLEGKMAVLREKATEMEKINAELLPILDRGLESLDAFVRDDLPFEKTERTRSVELTVQALSDYDMGLLAKTRALFDAVAREVDLGYSVDVREDEIDIEGRPTRVKLLRVGRTGLYALTMDAAKAYVWDARRKEYLPAAAGARDIDQAVQIVERIRIIELTRLPMGQPHERPGG